MLKMSRNTVLFFKGATSYEFQFRRLGITICHMKGEYWKWKPWKRVTFYWYDREQML